MIPRFRAAIGIRELLAPFRLADRRAVERYEHAFAEMAGQRFAIAMPHGRTALVLLLEALGLQGSVVVTPAYTCVVVQHGVLYAGARPVFVDASENSPNMDLEAAATIVARTGARALVSTSIFGIPVDLDRLTWLRKRHSNLIVLQDCAHGFFTEWNRYAVHREGVAAFYGTNISKLVTSIFGGMITTDDPELAERLRRLRALRLRPCAWRHRVARILYLYASTFAFVPAVYSLVRRMVDTGILDAFVRYYDPGTVEMPSDWRRYPCSVEARVGEVQIRRWPEIVAARRRAARYYHERLADLTWLRLPEFLPGATWSHYTVRTPYAAKLRAFAYRRGVELGALVDYVVPELPAYRAFRLPGQRFPHSLRWQREVVNLPIWTDEQKVLERVVQVLRSFRPEVGIHG